jgi:broad specificity phosphatase PhoE
MRLGACILGTMASFEHSEGGSDTINVSEASQRPEFLAEKLVARVTLMRHEETEYTGVGRDITERGLVRATEVGESITHEKGAPRVIGTSPKPRAVGTGLSVEEGVQHADPEASPARWITVPGLQATKFRDPEIHNDLTQKYGGDQAAWAEAHYDDPEFYNNPDKLESNEEKRSRMYRELERLVFSLEKQETTDEVPHLVFVSHYELLTLLLDDVFGIQTFGTPNTPTFGEHVDIELYQPDEHDAIPIRIQFRDHQAFVLFDRELRRLVATPASP